MCVPALGLLIKNSLGQTAASALTQLASHLPEAIGGGKNAQ